MKSYKIDFEPVGRRGKCPASQTLLQAAQRLGVELTSICGGRGTCGRCRIQVLQGEVSPPTATEREALKPQELADGYRLACQAYPLGALKLRVPPQSLTTPQRTQVEGLEVSVSPDPPVLAQHPELVSTARGRHLGLALDIGTTKLAGYLVDLDSGRTLESLGAMNPQIGFGEDVISRLVYARTSQANARRLQQLIVTAVNSLADDLCAQAGTDRGDILETVAVGNTAMHHLLLRLPVEQLAVAPFTPAVSDAIDASCSGVGLSGHYLHLLPNVAGFVGGDHVAMLSAIDVGNIAGLTLALDIGTNTEVALAGDGGISCASCASGPAFEGAHIEHGMRAAPGAIEHLRLVGDEVQYQTIGHAPAAGLCGSGILDAIAQLYAAGVLDSGGRMQQHPKVKTIDGMRQFVLVDEDEGGGRPAITVTQGDVRQLQLAKGAIGSGIRVLLESAGRTADEIEQVIIAGAFGSYIDVSSAVAIGLLPPLPPERFRQVGNAAGTGARLALISGDRRAEAQAIARRVKYIELSTAPDFMSIFIESTRIGSG